VRLRRRWTRRARRQWLFVGLALTSLAAALTVVVLFIVVPDGGATHHLLERIAMAWIALGSLLLAIFAIWRLDRTRRATRAVRIRLSHVERRMAALHATDATDRHARTWRNLSDPAPD
jgi:uncharacterized membrane protein YbhN (UPF0104 family)